MSCCVIYSHIMEQEVLDSEVKARVSEAQKHRLQELANERHLKVSDIIREAIREKIATTAIGEETTNGA